MKTHRNKQVIGIMRDVKDAIRQPYAWPGGYPKSVLMADGGILCADCIKENYRSVTSDTIKGFDTGWKAVGVDVLWDGGNHCDHCNECVDAYPEETEPQIATA